MTIREREKTAKANIAAFNRSDWRNIWQAYDRPSFNKEKAWSRCQQICNDHNGYNLKVINRNSFVFTAGFESIDPQTGVCLFTLITPNYTTTVEQ